MTLVTGCKLNSPVRLVFVDGKDRMVDEASLMKVSADCNGEPQFLMILPLTQSALQLSGSSCNNLRRRCKHSLECVRPGALTYPTTFNCC